MVKEAERAVKEYGLDFLTGDQLYMLSDLDHYRECILKQSGSTDKNFQLILSNPCVEIWFHYYYSSEIPDSEEFLEVSERKRPRIMKTYNGRYNNGNGINYSQLSTTEDIDIPTNNSENNFELEENNIIPALFSTQMHIVGKVIQSILNENSKIKIKKEDK